jgi:hypothetical protein
VGIDLLREHLGTLTVQPRRQRLTRYVTPHACIVAHARPARKELGKLGGSAIDELLADCDRGNS